MKIRDSTGPKSGNRFSVRCENKQQQRFDPFEMLAPEQQRTDVIQKRLYVTATEFDCENILAHLGDLYIDGEFATATQEIDEKNDIWEVCVYLAEGDEQEIRACFQNILDIHLPGAEIETEILPDIDWVAKSLEGLKPVRAGRFIIHGSHDREKVSASDIGIEIDAGQAFGTGHHGTTAGCLEMIDHVLRTRHVKNILDLGTGSGVLAIAARKICQVPILATDIDPIATKVAKSNAKLNGISTGLTFETAPGFHHGTFRKSGTFVLIIANILARPLMKMAPDLTRHLAPGGTVILSGILAEQRWKVLAAYNGQKLAHKNTIWRDGWVTIVLQG